MFKRSPRSFRDPKVLDECQLDKDVLDLLLQTINHRLAPQALKCRADIEVSEGNRSVLPMSDPSRQSSNKSILSVYFHLVLLERTK